MRVSRESGKAKLNLHNPERTRIIDQSRHDIFFETIPNGIQTEIVILNAPHKIQLNQVHPTSWCGREVWLAHITPFLFEDDGVFLAIGKSSGDVTQIHRYSIE
jgi:hypothetical protein